MAADTKQQSARQTHLYLWNDHLKSAKAQDNQKSFRASEIEIQARNKLYRLCGVAAMD